MFGNWSFGDPRRRRSHSQGHVTSPSQYRRTDSRSRSPDHGYSQHHREQAGSRFDYADQPRRRSRSIAPQHDPYGYDQFRFRTHYDYDHNRARTQAQYDYEQPRYQSRQTSRQEYPPQSGQHHKSRTIHGERHPDHDGFVPFRDRYRDPAPPRITDNRWGHFDTRHGNNWAGGQRLHVIPGPGPCRQRHRDGSEVRDQERHLHGFNGLAVCCWQCRNDEEHGD